MAWIVGQADELYRRVWWHQQKALARDHSIAPKRQTDSLEAGRKIVPGLRKR